MMNKLKITNKRDVWLCLAIIGMSLAGWVHTFVGSWSKSSGELAKMFPRFVYTLIILICAAMLIREFLGRTPFEPKAIAHVKWFQPLIFTALGAVFFLGVYYLGTAVSIFLFLVVMISLFAPDPKACIKSTLLVSLGATVFLWLIFTFVVPVVTPGHLLF